MRKRIVSWIRKRVKQARARGIVLGLSGGLDSAVVAALAKEAMGKRRTLALILPCHSQSQDLKDARLIARKLRIKTRTLDLSLIYDKLIKFLPKGNRLISANLKARLRMLVLYYHANRLNYLVCGTGNKSELMLGYFTKYGDGAADILPIGSLLKRQVRALARQMRIPENIIAKEPSAGLWPGQTDEREMGITYAHLDDILERREKQRRQTNARDKVQRVARMIERSAHKRQMPAICDI